MGHMNACFGFVHRAVCERHAGWPESSKMRIQREDSGIVHEDSEFAIPVSLSILPPASAIPPKGPHKNLGQICRPTVVPWQDRRREPMMSYSALYAHAPCEVRRIVSV